MDTPYNIERAIVPGSEQHGERPADHNETQAEGNSAAAGAETRPGQVEAAKESASDTNPQVSSEKPGEPIEQSEALRTAQLNGTGEQAGNKAEAPDGQALHRKIFEGIVNQKYSLNDLQGMDPADVLAGTYLDRGDGPAQK